VDREVSEADRRERQHERTQLHESLRDRILVHHDDQLRREQQHRQRDAVLLAEAGECEEDADRDLSWQREPLAIAAVDVDRDRGNHEHRHQQLGLANESGDGFDMDGVHREEGGRDQGRSERQDRARQEEHKSRADRVQRDVR
jgi:hypothetical protein